MFSWNFVFNDEDYTKNVIQLRIDGEVISEHQNLGSAHYAAKELGYELKSSNKGESNEKSIS